MRAALVASLLLAIDANDGPDDVGFLRLFEDAMEEIEDIPLVVEGDPIPDWVDGVFYQTGPAHWSFLDGHVKSPNAIFGTGKVHKWSFDNGKVTFTTKFPKKNMMTNVNVWLMNRDELAVLTDAPEITMIDPKNLSWTRSFWASNNSTGGFPDAASAHPHCAEDGSYVGLYETPKGHMGLFKLHPSNPDVVQEIASIDAPYSSYTHSFGLTKGMEGGEYAVIVRQPFPTGFGLPPWRPDFDFESIEGLLGNTHVHVVPMDNGASGRKAMSFKLDRFFFGHFANTFSPGPGKIAFDINRQQEIFFARFNFNVQSDKEKRDTWGEKHGNAYSDPTRYELDLETGTSKKTTLFPNQETQCSYGATSKWCEFELYALHPEDFGRPYCGFWAQHWSFNSTSFGSWAIVRVELCGAEEPRVVAHWYQPNAYPGEAQFVPKPGSTDKTEGVLIFKTYEGDTALSKLIVADAKTLQTISTAVLPVRIPFTVHGNYYSKAQLAAGQCIPAQETIV